MVMISFWCYFLVMSKVLTHFYDHHKRLFNNVNIMNSEKVVYSHRTSSIFDHHLSSLYTQYSDDAVADAAAADVLSSYV